MNERGRAERPYLTLSGESPVIRRGFTLFEVSLSLVLVAFGVISVLMLFPIGIKAEQMARLRLYAGVKAGEIIESFSTQSNENPAIDVEAPFQWEVPTGHRPFCPDLETRIATSRYGIMPVPRDIALRIESENDEIRRVLDQGGQLYYSKATGASGFQEATEGNVTAPTDALTQRLVFAVSGYAQNNAVPYLAQKTWPYHTPYPGPPSFGIKRYFRNVDQPSVPPMSTDASFLGGPQKNQFSLWEGITAGVPLAPTIGVGETPTGSLDPDIRLVFACGYRPYAFDNLVDTPALGDRDQFLDVPAASIPGAPNPLSLYFRRQLGAERYIQMALWYCGQRLLPSDYTDYSGTDPINDAKNTAELFKSVPDHQKWKYVQAMRFLSHAATCISKWARSDGTNSTTDTYLAKDKTPVDPRSGIIIRPMIINVVGTATVPAKTISMPAKTINHQTIVYYHELCMRLVMLYSASQPYDWGAPRPTQRALFTDYPLIEYDLFNVAQGPINGSGTSARQWKPITSSPVTNIGRSASFPNLPIPDTTWGDASHFTLVKQFEPAERCRQLTFWAADWMSYVDFETAVSAPIDASRYLFSAPVSTAAGTLPFDANKSPPSAGTPPSDRMNASQWYDQHLYAFRNPEHATLFTGPVTNVPTNWDLRKGGYSFNGFGARQSSMLFDYGSGGYNKAMFRGEYGGDRNFNNKLDRGPLPKSVRIRATTVARYAFYDPRLTLRLR